MKRNALLITLFLAGCTASTEDTIKSRLSKQDWKYGQGLNIGDWLDFNGAIYTVKSDTILLGDSAIARVKKIETGRVGQDDEVHITSIDGKRTGIYYSK